MIKNEIPKQITSQFNHSATQTINETITKCNSYQKEGCIPSNKGINISKKAESYNRVMENSEELTKYKNRKKRRSKDKIQNFLKNEKTKIPNCRRKNTSNDKINLNDTNNISKLVLQPPKLKIRTDKNGIEINKNNKKQVHITFKDEIPPYKITDTINIQSFKSFNMVDKFPYMNNIDIPICNKCCNIF